MDIYSFSNETNFEVYVSDLHCPHIRIKGQLMYDDSPAILGNYDVGVILYKGHIPNYIYNAPNKLFEYLACGLDVWVPVQMVGCIPYVTSHTWPKVTMIDFTNMESLTLNELISHENLTYAASPYYCEPVYEKLSDALCK